MAMGEKLFEEKGKYTMTFVESVDAAGITMKQSFSSMLTGFGRFPSGMNMGSGTAWLKPEGKAFSKWCGMMMTEDKEMIVWNASGNGKQEGDELKGVVVVTFMTKSEKYAWINTITAILELKGNMMEFNDVGYAWS
jgi:hypothetical protein